MAAAAIGFFAWTARSYFLSDDFTLLVQTRAPWSWRGAFATRGGDGSFRPAGYLSYVITARWAGVDPARWHWIGFILHAANALLVYALAAELGFSRFLSGLGAALFALHGSHPEAVLWVAGRFDLVATFFFLAAALAFVRSWKLTGWRRIFCECAALACMAIALLSKESAYSFPLVAALLVACYGSWDRRTRGMIGCLCGLTAALFAYRWMLLGGVGGYSGVSLVPSLKALSLRLWGVLFFPVNWSIRPEAALAAAALLYVAALARLFLVRARLSALVFAAGLTLLTAAPALTQLLIGLDLEKARVLYLPSAGVCLMLATLSERLPAKGRLATAAVLLLFHGMTLWHNLRGWQRASEVVQAACVTAAKCTAGTGRRVVVTGLSRTLNGVYTFANGFQDCVAIQDVRADGSDNRAGVCRFEWDEAGKSLRRVQ